MLAYKITAILTSQNTSVAPLSHCFTCQGRVLTVLLRSYIRMYTTSLTVCMRILPKINRSISYER